MPNRSTVISPFLAMHGWEPSTPLQLLYKGWVQRDIGPIDLEEWVEVNSERVQRMRDLAIANQLENSTKRKEEWDKQAQFRQFEKGEKVYLRKSGLNTKLEESWAGPYSILKRNSSLSYRATTGDRVLPSVHIQLLKRYTPRVAEEAVKRVTMLLNPDTTTDSIEEQHAEAKVSGRALNDSREQDIANWERDFSDILTKELGLTRRWFNSG